jgi:predicted Fe-Mo cluster-binding NifX family protein
VCVPVTPEERVDPRFGRTERLALASVEGDPIRAGQEVEAGRGELDDTGAEGGDHARAACFLHDRNDDVVLKHHIGANSAHMLERMGIAARVGVDGDVRSAASEEDELPAGANLP